MARGDTWIAVLKALNTHKCLKAGIRAHSTHCYTRKRAKDVGHAPMHDKEGLRVWGSAPIPWPRA